MVEIFLGRCPTISSPTLQTATAYQSLGLATWLIFTYKSLAKDGCPIILINMETLNAISLSNSSINTPGTNVITRVLHYMFTHVSTLNYLLNAGFLANCYRITKVFPQITRKSCNREIFPP